MEFVVTILSCFVYSWSMQTFDSDDSMLELDHEHVCSALDVYLKKVFKQSVWNQIQIKLVDWLIHTFNNLKQVNANISAVVNIKRKYRAKIYDLKGPFSR